jgi:hypothetical protein
MKYSRRGNWLCCIQMGRRTLFSSTPAQSDESYIDQCVAQNANTNDDLKHMHLYLGLFLAGILPVLFSDRVMYRCVAYSRPRIIPLILLIAVSRHCYGSKSRDFFLLNAL